MFADSRARNGAAGVIGESACADDGGIADASPQLVHHPASRCSEIAGFVPRRGANGSELFLLCLRMIENGRMLLLCLCQLLDTGFGQEILSVFKCYTVFAGELFGAFAD